LLRIAPDAARVTDTLRVGLANSEGAFAFQDGSVWLQSDTAGTLSRVDPRSGRVFATVQMKPHSYTAIAAFGSV
jgi:streptogramin lyase